MRKTAIIFFLLTIIGNQLQTVQAQTPATKTIELSDTLSYSEDIALGGSPALTATLRFSYSEADTTLTVCLKPKADDTQKQATYVFGFNTPVRYKEVVGSGFEFMGIRLTRPRLKPEHMPYPVSSKWTTRYRLTSEFRSQVAKPRNGYVFQPWVTGYGMDEFATDNQSMLNDSIERRFRISNTFEDVFVHMGNIIGMVEHKRSRAGRERYELTTMKSPDSRYRIRIKRDTCMAYQDTLASLRRQLDAMRKDSVLLGTLHNRFHVKPTKTGSDMFNGAYAIIMPKYKTQPQWHPCTEMWACYDQYNALLKSMTAMECTYEEPEDGDPETQPEMQPLDVPALLKLTRNINRAKLQLISAVDKIDIANIIAMCELFISDGEDMISKSSINTERERTARDNFEKAVESFTKRSTKN